MKQLYTAAQVRELDRIAIEERGTPGIALMKRAGEACTQALLARWPAPKKVCVLCGSGNNAGDGYIIAGLLQSRQVPAQVVAKRTAKHPAACPRNSPGPPSATEAEAAAFVGIIAPMGLANINLTAMSLVTMSQTVE